MSEQEWIARGFGKWSQRGVPHKGWTCIGVEDLGREDRAICEMCLWTARQGRGRKGKEGTI
jgi:hypothetical protein